MKKSLTSIISLLLSFMILVSAFPITASAAEVGNIVGIFLAEGTEEPIANLEVTLQDASRNVLDTTTTGPDGSFVFTGCEVGEYYVIPTGAAYHGFDDEYLEENGYYVIVVSDGDNTFFKGGNTRYLRETLGSGKLIKIEKDTNKPIPGTVFEFYNSKDELLGTYTTDSNGEIVVGDLSLGNYYFLEKTPAEGYFASSEKAYVEVKDSSEATVTVTNDPICSITLVKTDRDTGEPLIGAAYELRDSTDTLLDTYVTNADGVIEITGLRAGDYKLVEYLPPIDHYIGDNGTHEITLSPASSHKTILTTNAKLPTMRIVKESTVMNKLLSGAMVDIKQGDKIICDDLVINEEVEIALEPGNYTVVEVKAPVGYILDSTPVDFTVVDDPTVENIIRLNNNPIIVEISKFGEDENGSFLHDDGKKYSYLPGCEFVMTNTADPSISYTWTTGDHDMVFAEVPVGEYEIREISAPELYNLSAEPFMLTVVESDTLNYCHIFNSIKTFNVEIEKVNPVGKYVFTDFELSKGGKVLDTFTAGYYQVMLQPGTYTVTELSAPEGYAKAPAFEFVLDTNGKVTASANFVEVDENIITIINNPIVLNISKIDAETNVLLSGATLKLSKNDGTYEKEFVTDGSVIVVDEGLTPGEYTLEEINAPDGYLLAAPITFTINDVADVQSVVLKNNRMLGTITVNKTGETLRYVGVSEKITGFFVNIFEVLTGQTPLGGVTFTLYADQDIKHPDGVSANIYNKGDVVATGITDSYGMITFDKLPLGVYALVETDAPTGYYSSEPRKTILVSSEDIVNVGVENYYKEFVINIEKIDSTDSNKFLEGAVYGLYTNEDVLAPDGSVIISKNSLVSIGETDDTGYLRMVLHLPTGKYVLKELKAPEGYIISDETRTIDLDFDDITVSAYSHSTVFTNDPITIEIGKLDKVSSDFIPGAKLELIAEDGSVYASWTTQSEAKVLKAVPAGKYTLHEVSAPNGYKLAEDVQIEVKETAEKQSFIMMDDRVTGSVTVNKFVKGTTTPLPGVTFELYNETLNLFVGTFTTNANGQVYIPNLAVASYNDGIASGHMSYRLTEVVTQPGYVFDNTPYTFMLNVADPNYTVETDATLSVENDYTKVHVYKADADNGQYIAGAELAIYPFSEYDMTKGEIKDNAVPYATWISGTDAYVFEKMPIGDYVLVELNPPAGYRKAANLIFTVENSGHVNTLVLNNYSIKAVFSKFDKDGTTYLPGAEFALYEKSQFNDDLTLKDNAQPFETWVSGTMDHIIYRIPVGDYLLVETKAPAGYVEVNPMLITIQNNLAEFHSFEITNDCTKVSISKQDITNKEELPGAHLSIYDYETYNTLTDNPDAAPLYNWVSTDTPYYIEKLPIGKYVLVETIAPAGYVKSEAVEFEVKASKHVQNVTMYNDITTVSFFKIDAETEKFLPGAEFEIYTVDSNNNPVTKVYEWTSTDEEFTITKMPVGKYVLYETKAPSGYVADLPLFFEVMETTKEQIHINRNTKTTVKLSKIDVDGNLLPNAKYEIYDETQFDENLKLIDDAEPMGEWISSDEAEEFRGVPAGKYLFVEVESPAGYIASSPVLVEVKSVLENQAFEFVNKPTHIGIYKVDSKTGDTVAGAKLELYYAEDYVDGEFVGEPIAEWDTTLEMKEFNALPVGKYIVREVSVPAGYTTAEPLEIVVEETTELQIFNLLNNKTIVSISKLDKDTKEFLPGAEFVIYFDINNNDKVDDEDVEVGKWVSTDEAYTVEGLPVGKYILVETKAPEGYETIENVILTIRDTSELQIFEVYNEKIPEPTVKPDVPNMGDRAPLIISGIFLTAGLVLVLTILAKKDKIKVK